jgi:hypothetical protein
VRVLAEVASIFCVVSVDSVLDNELLLLGLYFTN